MILTCWTCLPLFLLSTVPAVLKLFQSCPWESTDDLKQLCNPNSSKNFISWSSRNAWFEKVPWEKNACSWFYSNFNNWTQFLISRRHSHVILTCNKMEFWCFTQNNFLVMFGFTSYLGGMSVESEKIRANLFVSIARWL